ncbi:BTAD domain-containing putative transcriptional regulator [Azospirillum sp.]|uniref:BTAD domain-containing putative transcriptional regulator n=1 Tax=Azospirillum sp. TaxID=34012 RepID=UPI003D750B8E
MDGPTLRLLGGFSLADAGGQALGLPGRNTQLLLACVALNAPRPVPRERLAGLLWDEREERRALHSLRQCLMELRRLGDRAGGELIRADRTSVSLALPLECVDGLAVERLAREGTPDALRAAAALCAGTLLPEAEAVTEGFDDWLAGERARFARLAAGVFARLTALCEAEGRWEGVVSAAERWLALDPACEEAHRSLMRLHARHGRRSDAVRQYQVCAAAVRRCLDAEPEEETVELLRSIRGRLPAAPTVGAPAGPLLDLPQPERPALPDRPSLAVLPFGTLGGPAEAGGFADGVASDVLVRLSRLRSLFVIARGSSFRFRGAQIDPCTVGRALGVRYLVTGSVRTHGGRLRLTVELAQAETGAAVWSDLYDRRLDDVFAVQDELASRIAAALDAEIEAAEMRRALTAPAASLDAWSAYHRGLWHMFRFTRDGNETARALFQHALRTDPLSARAHAGLSFTHFQDAFLHHTGHREIEAERAYRFAEQSVSLDERDPASHLALGRALWLLERQADAVEELALAVDLNPNFALGHYSLAFVQAQGGDARAALRAADVAQRLSPFDPLLFGMLGARALAYLDLREHAQAAVWGERAARRPNAHVHIHAIAAFSTALADRREEAWGYARRIKEVAPSYRCGDFLAAFRTLSPPVAELIRRVGPCIGIPS